MYVFLYLYVQLSPTVVRGTCICKDRVRVLVTLARKRVQVPGYLEKTVLLRQKYKYKYRSVVSNTQLYKVQVQKKERHFYKEMPRKE